MSYSKNQHLQANIEVIKQLFTLDTTHHAATSEQLDLFSRYSGFGALKCVLLPAEKESDKRHWTKSELDLFPLVQELRRVVRTHSTDERAYRTYMDSIKSSVLTSFYTPTEVVQALSCSLVDSGLQQVQRILEPSAGVGRFIADFKTVLPQSEVTAYEKDIITGKILQHLYPTEKVHVAGFETLPERNKGYFDIVTSNIPFGTMSVFDADFLRDAVRVQSARSVHNYFFIKGLDTLREGGILAFITSQGVADAATNRPIREYLMQHANLVSALRLPNNLFSEHAGTDVGSDLIILQKNSAKVSLSESESHFIEQTRTKTGNVPINLYLYSASRMVHTDFNIGTDMYGKPGITLTHSGGIEGIASDLSKKLRRDIELNFNLSLYEQHTLTRSITPSPTPIEQSIPSPVLTPILTPAPKSAVKKKKVVVSSTPQLALFDLLNRPTVAALQPVNTVNSNLPIPYKGEIFKHLKAGSVVKNEQGIGVLSQNDDGDWLFTALQNKDTAKVSHYIDIRETYYLLSDNENQTLKEDSENRVNLNQQYDDFVSKYGQFNSDNNKNLIKLDGGRRDVFSLERKEGTQYVKSDIFTKPVAFSTGIEIRTAEEALFASLNTYAAVRLDYMSELINMPKDVIIKELEGKIYYNPVGNGEHNYEISAQFLSGNIVQKIDTLSGYAKTHPADSEVSASLSALHKVLPEKIPFELLEFNYGERWLPLSVYSDFATHLFNTKATMQYFETNDVFSISVDNEFTPEIRTKYFVRTAAGRRHDGIKLMQYALMDSTPTVEITIKNSDGSEKRVKDSKAMQLINGKVDDIRNEFIRWLNVQPQTVKDDIVDIYNRKFNCFVKPAYDGSHQTFADLSLEKFDFKDLYSTQKDAIFMLKQNGGGIIDHEVGGGKTLTMCVAAHEMKRLGIANKPLIIGMKANIQDIAQAYRNAFPDAKVLYAGSKEESFKKKTADAFALKAKNNDYDVVIMTHEQFVMIEQPAKIKQNILQDELFAAEENLRVATDDDGLNKQQLRGLETKRNNIATDLKEVNSTLSKRQHTDAPDFAEIGFDHIFVDESHKFKNLMFQTRHDRVAGLGNTTGSDRSVNLLYAIRTIQARTGKDLGATFLSGTTISNSLTELYSIFKYLRPRALDDQNIHSFDAWAAIFAKKTKDYEFSVTNEIILKERFRHFIKVPELASFYGEITDYKSAADIRLDRPEKNEILYNIPPTAEQQEFTQKLIEFARTGNATILGDKSLTKGQMQAKMLLATNYARKMSLDMRLIDPEKYSDHIDNKLSHCAKNVMEYYQKFDAQKGTQFVFCDTGTPKTAKEWSAYKELKDKLIQKGIPEKEIKFIHDTHTDKQRDKLFEAMNAGKVRVLIGSTDKLGTGVNAQERAVAVHDLDTPWTPAGLEQRHGRAVRTGNKVAKLFNNNKVDVFIYATERTLDTYKFNLLQNKQQFISQIKNNKLGQRSIDEGAIGGEDTGMSFAEYVAVLSGNTNLLAKAKLEKKINALESERNTFYNEKYLSEKKIQNIHETIEANNVTIKRLQGDLQTFNSKKIADGTNIMTMQNIDMERAMVLSAVPKLMGLDSQNVEIIGKKLNEINEIAQTNGRYEPIGALYGGNFTVTVKTETTMKEDIKFAENRFFVEGQGGIKYSYNHGFIAKDPEKACQNFYNALSKIPEIIENHERKNAELAVPLPVLQGMQTSTWPKENELKALKTELSKLTETINERMPSQNKEVTEQEQNGQLLTTEPAKTNDNLEIARAKLEKICDKSGIPHDKFHILHIDNKSEPVKVLQKPPLITAVDCSIRHSIACDPAASPEILTQLSKDEDWGVRCAVARNPSTSPEAFAQLSKDENSNVRRFVANNPCIPAEILAQLAKNEDWFTRRSVADNSSTPPEVLTQLSKDEDSSVRGCAINNPNISLEEYVISPEYANIIKQMTSFGGVNISVEQRDDLCNGKTIKLEGIVRDKTKQKYTADIKINKETGKVEFETCRHYIPEVSPTLKKQISIKGRPKL